MSSFQIKICGVRTTADAVAAADAGADAVGLNFFARSSRYVDPAVASEISRALAQRVTKVGVFVNATADEISEIADRVGLDVIQLHGDEPPAVLRALAPRPVMKAFRVGPEGLAPIRRWLEEAMHLGLMPQRVLLDAYQPGEYGGTGRTADWPAAATFRARPVCSRWCWPEGSRPTTSPRPSIRCGRRPSIRPAASKVRPE
ncbi:MAG: phosphoribosylanthranilate isomerase [Pirellulales bacterium]